MAVAICLECSPRRGSHALKRPPERARCRSEHRHHASIRPGSARPDRPRRPALAARRRTRPHTRSIFLGSGAVPTSLQNTHEGVSGQPRATRWDCRCPSRSKSVEVRDSVRTTRRALPDFGELKPWDVMERLIVILRDSRSTSAHWSPSASPRLIPVAKRSSRRTNRASRISMES